MICNKPNKIKISLCLVAVRCNELAEPKAPRPELAPNHTVQRCINGEQLELNLPTPSLNPVSCVTMLKRPQLDHLVVIKIQNLVSVCTIRCDGGLRFYS